MNNKRYYTHPRYQVVMKLALYLSTPTCTTVFAVSKPFVAIENSCIIIALQLSFRHYIRMGCYSYTLSAELAMGVVYYTSRSL